MRPFRLARTPPVVRLRAKSVRFRCHEARFLSSSRHSSPDPRDGLRQARPLVPDVFANKFTSAGSSRSSRTVVVLAVVGAVSFYLYNSQTVPVTGRRRFNFLSDRLVERAHASAAEAVIRSVQEQGGHFLSDWDPRTMLVKRVMRRLIPVSGLPGLDWEVRVIADNSTCARARNPGALSLSLSLSFSLSISPSYLQGDPTTR